MVTTFIANPGSTSRKYAVYRDAVCVVRIFCESTGAGFAMSVIENQTKVSQTEMSASEFAQSASFVLSFLVSEKYITSLADIIYVGIRVVAPGTLFTHHTIIDATYIDALRNVQAISPLHTPHLIDEIITVQKTLPKTSIVGISDSNFHTTIPEHIRRISVPEADAQAFDIYRFGYHGISFASIARNLQRVFDEVPKRTIVCHIGGGVSVGALRNGVSAGTSMGYSPVSGILMGSRGGDITAGVVAGLMVQKRLSGNALYEYLYKECGFKGVAGVSDLRLLLERKANGDEKASLAVKMFIHQIHNWIGSHAVLLGGVDAIVLTATASERNAHLRKLVLSNLSLLGVNMDFDKNEALVGGQGLIHTSGSQVKIAVMRTDEMGEMNRIVHDYFL